MKSSIKISAVLLMLLAISFGVRAQSTTSTSSSSSSSSSNGIIYSVGVESGISSGKFNSAYRWNIGGSLEADIPVASQFYFNVNAGYLNFNNKNNIDGTGFSGKNISLLPATAGLKYFPVSIFYIQANAGAAFILDKRDLDYNKTAAFLYTPGVGVKFSVGGDSYIDAGVKYEGTTKYTSNVDNSKINFFELRVAYGFGIK
jgi:hypothetical protein